MTPLRHAVTDYLTLRRRLGVTLAGPERVLLAFSAYAQRAGIDHVTTDVVSAWALAQTRITPATRRDRVQMVRRFAQWRQLSDARTEVPPVDLCGARYRRHPPYVYDEDDIPRLLTAARRLPSPKGLRGATYATLFGLLVVTGLRSSEVVNVDDSDIDRREATLLIRRTKFGKSRVIPLHPSTMAAVTGYQRRRDRLITRRTCHALFVSEQGVRITQIMAEYTFARISGDIGLRPPVRQHHRGHGPRLHDLRHRFAIQTLVHWYRAGHDVDPLLPVLATYLGHVHVHDTYWYLEAVPELLRLATERLARAGEAVTR